MRWLLLSLLLFGCGPRTGADDDDAATDDDDASTFDPSGLPAGGNPAHEPITGLVEYVNDGDTFHVDTDGGESIRVLAINTPEMNYGDDWGPDCWAPQATARAEFLLPEGERVWLTFDGEYADDFDRLLAYVFIGEAPEGATIEDSFNYLMIAEGHAWTFFFDNNRTYEQPLRQAENAARAADLGVWSCP